MMTERRLLRSLVWSVGILAFGCVLFVIWQLIANRAAFLQSVIQRQSIAVLSQNAQQQQIAINAIETRCSLSLACVEETCDLMLTCPGALPANLGSLIRK